MIDNFRPRRGQMYIELNVNRKYTTPLGSHFLLSNLYYKRTIPSGLTKIDKFRPRRGQMYIELNANRKYTTPLGSHYIAMKFCYKHSIPSGLTN